MLIFPSHSFECVLCSTEPFSLHHQEYLFPVSVCRLQGPLLRSTLHKKGSSQEAARLGAKRRQGVCTPPCFLQLVLRLICLHPCKRADGLNVFQVYDISSSFNLKSLYLSFIQHSIQGVMLQSDVTRLTGVLPLHIRVKLRNTLQLR